MTKIYYIGDSTVQFNNIHTYPQTGMSQGLARYLRQEVLICPHGKNGRSTKSFLEEWRFAPVKEALEPGDFLFIQFGHNDEKGDPLRHTDPFGTYQENLRYFVTCAQKAKVFRQGCQCWRREGITHFV